jgi:hypothetical protein
MFLENQFKADMALPRLPDPDEDPRIMLPRMDKLRAGRAITIGVPLSMCLWGALYLIWKFVL